MSAIKATFFCILAFILVSCGQAVKEKLTIPYSGSDQFSCLTTKKIVMLPFADYSSDFGDVEGTMKRNMAVMEAITDKLTAKGFRLPIDDDIVRYLVKNDIIKMASSRSSSSNYTSSLENELRSGEWSETMRNELKDFIKIQNTNQPQSLQGVDKNAILKIGRDFNADYILRGRIIKYSLEDENTWHPVKRGILPVFFGGTERFLFGFAKSEEYDNVNSAVVGGALGAAIGYGAGSPYSLIDSTSYQTYNGLFWGAVGATAAYIAKQSGEAKQAVVHLRVWIQDPSTSDVIWTNRAEVKVAPRSAYADKNAEALFHTAINQAAGALVDDFWMKSETTL